MAKKRETQHKIVENYKLYEEIGSGQYGKVFKSVDTKTGDIFAIKVIPLQKFANVPKLEEFTENEIKTLGRINNPNVIKFTEMLKTTNNMYLVYEFCEGGTLERQLIKRHHLPEFEALKIFKQLLNAFKALYKENILHRDLKPSNIFIHKDCIKIADFGFCKRVTSPYDLSLTMVGSPIYMAPEILKGLAYSIKADIWSLGVVLYEMLFGVCPYEDQSLAGLLERIEASSYYFRKDVNNITLNTENLLKKLLIKDSKARMDWNELLEYPLNIEEAEAFDNLNKMALQAGPKVDFGWVEKYDDSKEEQKKILNILMRERNKVIYMIDIILSILDYNLSSKAPLLAYILIKKTYNKIETIKKDISIDNISLKFINLSQWSVFKSSDQFYGFSLKLNEEFDETVKILDIYKKEIQNMINYNPYDSELNDSNFKLELYDNYINPKYSKNLIISYVEEINQILKNQLLKQLTDDQMTKYIIHGVNVLECENLDDFFDKNIDYNISIYDQGYFKKLFTSPKERLQETLNNKIASARALMY